MVLNTDEPGAGRVCLSGRRRLGMVPGEPGGKIIRVQIGGDQGRARLVELLEVLNHTAESIVSRFGFQVADMLAQKDLRAYGQGGRVLQMRADGQHGWRGIGRPAAER